MTAYRIGLPHWPLLDGGGAALSDQARWNDRGRRIIYAAQHYSTAVLEVAARLSTVRIPATFVFIEIRLPESSVELLSAAAISGWDADDKAVSRAFGNRWYDERRSLALIVPSLVAPGLESNVLINQSHPDFRRVKSTGAKPILCHPRLLL